MNSQFADQLEAVTTSLKDKVVNLERNVIQSVGLASEIRDLENLAEIARTETGGGVPPAPAPSSPESIGLPPRREYEPAAPQDSEDSFNDDVQTA